MKSELCRGCLRAAGGGLLAAALAAAGFAQQNSSLAPPPSLNQVSRSATPLPAPALALPDNIQADLVTPAAPDSYIIGNDDLLTVFVYQMPELTRQLRVSDAGTIRLPFVRRQFHAAGKTAPQLQREIATTLRAEGLARAPMVQVVVRQVESKPIVVAGAVRDPMTLQAARPMSLLEILSRAGGLSTSAGNTVLITSTAADRPAAASYSLAQLIRHGNPRDNPQLTGHQMVTVLPARLIYVVGAFRRPGAFPLRTGEPISVLNAIALAQGLKGSPDKGNAEIITTLPTGARREIRIHIGRILRRKAPDPRLSAGDILYVPQDRKHQMLMSALQDAAQATIIFIGYHL